MCLGVPGQVVELVDAAAGMAWVEISGVRRCVSLACLLSDGCSVESLLGQWVLVHVGFAMSLVDADEAERTLGLIRELERLAEDDDAIRG
ncbi:MAG: HypC/HybG/HupF family hydrogenase formation chaperone [Marinobacterium sp.]